MKCKIYCCEESVHLLVEILFNIDSKVSGNSTDVGVLSLSAPGLLASHVVFWLYVHLTADKKSCK